MVIGPVGTCQRLLKFRGCESLPQVHDATTWRAFREPPNVIVSASDAIQGTQEQADKPHAAP
jgi:hypothetical protein